MKVAALYDVHGNLPALEAVLADVRREGVDRLVVGGDVVPGPMPRECLALLLDLPLPVDFVRGNGEGDVLAVRRGDLPARVPERFHEVLRWVADALSPEQAAEIASWPPTVVLDTPAPGRILFCHATPRDDSELFTRLTPEDRLRPVFAGVDADVVVCGHTHMQFDRVVAGTRVVNAGSVGMPFGEPGAYWAMLGPGVEPRRTAYDLTAAGERLARTGFPEEGAFDVARPAPEARMVEAFEAAALT